jgi:putative PEP-CTERM system TPR-repeat lipoprotein
MTRRPVPRLIRTLIAGLAFASMLAACSGDNPEKHLAKAGESMTKRDFRAAIIEIKNALQLDPNRVDTRIMLARALLESGDPKSAELELGKAQELGAPADDLVPLQMRTWLATGQAKRIIDEATKAKLTNAGATATVQSALGEAYLATGKPEDAAKAIAMALQAKPDDTYALLAQARLRMVERKPEESAAIIDRLLAHDAASAEAWRFKGDLQNARGERSEALVSYRKAVEARPDYVQGHYAVVSNLLAQTKLEDATQALAAMKKVSANHPLTLSAATLVAFGAKDFKAARESTQLLLRMAPDNPQVLLQAGAAEYQMKSYAQAETLLAKVIKSDPGSVAARRWLTLTYLASGQPEKAIDTLKPIIEKIRGDANMLMLAGESHMRAGDATRAEEFFVAASKLEPNDPRKRTSVALTRVAKGEADAGFAELEQISAADTGISADMALIASHLRRGEIDQGLKAIDSLEKKQPDNPLPHEMRGRLLLAKRDVAGARKSFERALALKSTYFPAVAGLAALDVNDKKPEEAAKRFEALVAADPQNVQAYLALAGLKMRAGAPNEEVAALINKAVAAGPGEVSARAALVELHLRAKDPRKAIAAAQDAVAAMPERPELLDLLGQAQQANGEFNQALASYEKQVKLQPTLPRPLLRMAEINVAAKRPDAAVLNLRNALALKADLVEAQRGLIMLNLQSGKDKDALALAHEVQKQRPKEAVGFMLEGDVASSQKSWDKAATAYRAGLKLAPEAGQLAVKLHGVLQAGGNKAEGDRFATAWVKDHPKDYGFQMHLAETALARNELEGASTRFRNLLAVMPENPAVLNNLAWVAGKLKAPDAVPLAEKANQLAPNQPAFMDTLAMLLLDKGDTARALELLNKAVELQPQAYGIRLNQARVLIKAGKKTEARRVLEDLTALGDKFPARAEIDKLAQQL